MHNRIIPAVVALALSVTAAAPALASEITGTLTGGSGSSLSGTVGTSGGGSLSGTVGTSSGGSLSGTVGGASLSGTVTSPSGGGGGGGGATGGGGGGGATTGTPPGSVLGTATDVPSLPSTGAGGNAFGNILVLVLSALTTLGGLTYLRYRTH